MSNGITMKRFGDGYRAVVCGASGGIGAAFADLLSDDPACAACVRLSRAGTDGIAFDLEDEASIAAAAQSVGADGPVHLVIDATGMLHTETIQPEKSLSAVEPASIAAAFAVNATGPLLLLKHFTPLMPRDAASTFATLSARVSSISDNRLGGWYGYRAAKAALNMFVKTAAIEIARKSPEAVIMGLHPGTVRTDLSAPFAGKRELFEPRDAATRMLDVIDTTGPDQSGSLFAYDGEKVAF
ncbi:MAG: SDR family NAD(P)-dependent oxidoreductase [Pseudomonadota bacterium]